jgi:hypothetical protein
VDLTQNAKTKPDFHSAPARQVILAGHLRADQNVPRMETALPTLPAPEKNVSIHALMFVDSMLTVKLSTTFRDALVQETTTETRTANAQRFRKSSHLLSLKNQLILADRHRAEATPTVRQLATEQFASVKLDFLATRLLLADLNAFSTVNVHLTRLASTRSALIHVRALAASMPFVMFTIISQFACAKKDSLEILSLAVN